MLQGKKVIVGITGSIAAYKAALLCRNLQEHGAIVRVVMTPSACTFITPLTLSALTGHPVHSQIEEKDTWNNHVELGLWADLMIIAPCTATTLGRMAGGLSDNLLMAVYLSVRCPVMIAPAMDTDMWHHPAVRRNVDVLRQQGHMIIPVGTGKLASGLTGEGRMAEPHAIIEEVTRHFAASQDLKGKNIVITSGPTREAIDPVRCITNRSSGKMGAALAKACLARGGTVTIVSGPVARTIYPHDARVVWVESALDMMSACQEVVPAADWVFFAAAVADYRPADVSESKMKKTENDITLRLVRNPDIAQYFSTHRTMNQRMIGFALESEDNIGLARAKLHTKQLDCIVYNSLKHPGAGFDADTNKVMILSQDGDCEDLATNAKDVVAAEIISYLVTKFIH